MCLSLTNDAEVSCVLLQTAAFKRQCVDAVVSTVGGSLMFSGCLVYLWFGPLIELTININQGVCLNILGDQMLPSIQYFFGVYAMDIPNPFSTMTQTLFAELDAYASGVKTTGWGRHQSNSETFSEMWLSIWLSIWLSTRGRILTKLSVYLTISSK